MHLPKVLITTMGLDIGGAETHIITLSKNLKSLGCNVIVASSGGVYESELEKFNIKHYKVCLNTKRPLSVFYAFLSLCKIVKAEKIDIIHAHARIPAFICNIVSRICNVRFITTAHAKFRSNFILRHISVWGKHTIAVSEDIKEHLINQFGVRENKISVISNGIDTNEFNSSIDCDSLYNEFLIDPQNTKILWVSRIDEALSDTIEKLIQSVDNLSSVINKLSIFIVGDGEKFEDIKKIAHQKNIQLKKDIIFTLGKRTDVNRLLNMCDIFVGISRSALEAMACEKPVILAGPWSFVGIFNQDLLETACSDNFTGRNGKDSVTSDLLSSAIIKIQSMSKESRQALGKYGREIVNKYYSSSKMTEDTLEIYKKMINKEM